MSTDPYYYIDIDTIPCEYEEEEEVLYNDKTTNQKVNATIKQQKNGCKYDIQVQLDDGTGGVSNIPDVPEENLEPMDPFAPRGLDTLFSDPTTYEKIAAVNGYGFLQIVKNFKGIMHHSDMSPEEQFVFQNDLCQYLFTIPDGKKDFSYELAIKNPDFKMQMCFLAVIHQLHFIGILTKVISKQASTDPTRGKGVPSKSLGAALKAMKEAIAHKEKAIKEMNDKKNILTGSTGSKGLITELTDLDTRIRALPSKSSKTPEEETAETNIQSAETALEEARSKVIEEQSKLTRHEDELNDLFEKQNNAIEASDSDAMNQLLIDIDALKKTINTIKTTSIPGLNTNETTAKVEFDRQITEGKTNNYVFPYFKERDQLKKKIDTAQTNLDTATENVKELDEIVKRRTELVSKLRGEKTKERNEKVYNVPDFRGKSSDEGTNDDKQESQRVNAFVSKYKYARDFTILAGSTTIIKETDLDTIIISIFKYLQNSTYSVQTLKSIQARLTEAKIIGALGKSSEESASAPGTNRSLSREEISSRFAKIHNEAIEEKINYDQLGNVIIQRGIDFLTVYAPSLRKEYTGKISSAVKIEDIDRSLQETYNKLKASKSPAEFANIEREYTSIRNNILTYQRLNLGI